MKTFLLSISVSLASFAPAIFAETVARGTQIEIRPDNPVDVSRWDRGRIYPAHVARDVYSRDGGIAIPRGSYAELIVRRTGPDQYTLDLESVTVADRRYVLDTAGQQFNMPRNDYDGGNGLVGSIIGAIAQANGQQVETHGAQIRVPAGSMLNFQLQEPLHTVDWRDPGYKNNNDHYHREHDWYR